MDAPLTTPERRALAARLGLDEQYLYQCLTGRGRMKVEKAVWLERASGGVLRRWHVRPEDWHLQWPELVGSEGAPPVPTPKPKAQPKPRVKEGARARSKSKEPA